MKKLVLFLLFLPLMMGLSKANPIFLYHTQFKISELLIQSAGNWYLEITVTVPVQLSLDSVLVDSLVLESNGIRARIRSFPITTSDFMVVITQDSLISPLSISNVMETLWLHSYTLGIDNFGTIFPGIPDMDELQLGYPNCEIPTLLTGQSICSYNYWYHYKDNTPTIGLENDTIDATSTMRGKVYDLNFNIVTGRKLKFYDELDTLRFNDDSTYYYNVLARKSVKNQIYDFTNATSYYQTDTMTVNSEPNSIISKNIHILNILNDIREVSAQEKNITMINVPNPFNRKTTFYINIPEGIHFSRGKIDIYNLLGDRITQKPLPLQNKISVDINLDNCPAGVYYYSLTLDNQVSKTGQIVLLK